MMPSPMPPSKQIVPRRSNRFQKRRVQFDWLVEDLRWLKALVDAGYIALANDYEQALDIPFRFGGPNAAQRREITENLRRIGTVRRRFAGIANASTGDV